MTIDRFDFSQQQRDLLNKAVALGVTDAVGLGCLIAEFGKDFDSIRDNLDEYNYSCRHHYNEKNHAWISASEEYFANNR